MMRLCALVLVVRLAMPGAAQAQAVPSPDAAAVEASVRRYVDAMAALDTTALRTAVTDDFAGVEGARPLDRASLIAILVMVRSAGWTMTYAPAELAVTIRGDVALASYLGEVDAHVAGQPSAPSRWRESMVLVRARSGWRVAALHRTQIRPSGP